MSDERDGGVVQTFESLGPDGKECLRLFARGGTNPGCYILGWWAHFAAKEYIKSSTVLKNWGTPVQPVDVVVVNDTMCKELIRDCLLRRGAAVEFYDRPAGGGAYRCVQRGSPGNIADFEASLFEFEEAEIQLMATGALVLGRHNAADGGIWVGFAALNTTLRQLTFAEYLDTVQLVNLDALIAQTNLKELRLCINTVAGQPSTDEEQVRAVRRMCERANIIFCVTSLKELRQQQQQDGSGPYALDALKEILRVPEETMLLSGLKFASHAVENVLSQLNLLDAVNQRAFYIKRVAPATHMMLDLAAIEALNLVTRKPEPRGTLPTSLFTWLNRCSTGMGSRTMRQWLLQPLRNVDDINQRLTTVEIFVENPVLRDMLLAQVLKRCSDMDRLNRKLQRRTVALKDTQAVLTFVNVIPDAVQVLKTYHGRDAKLLSDEYIAPLEDIHEHMENLKTLIEATVDFSDRSMVRINPRFDDALHDLHTQICSVRKEIDREFAEVLHKYSWNEKQLKCEYHTTYGYVFRVSRKEDRQLRSSSSLITVSTAKDGVRFVSEKLSALSDQYRRLNEDYDARQQELKCKLIDTIASYLPVLDDAKELIAALDVFVAWAIVAKESTRPLVRPVVMDSNASPAEGGEASVPIISLKNLRHPLVELRQPNYITNSIQLTRDANGLIITGPNMGGKSTFMRSVGIAVVLAQIGCFVPADAAEIHVRDAVMCRVGATDHLAQGVSTFMVEMIETAAILSSATPSSLAIVDELGRGTSTYDGFGLAWAIAQEVAGHLRAALLFSTHFHELTQLPAQCSNLRNMHFGADVNEAAGTLRFSYMLETGPCGRSYGLYVAALAHLPAEVIEHAKEKAAELESFDDEPSSSVVKSEDDGGAARQRLAEYAKRVRELEAQPATPEKNAEVKRLKHEISEDVVVRAMLAC